MKRFISFTLLFAILFTSSVYADTPKIGDTINQVLATDIVAYIDGMPINSYNIDGYTAVIVEDLDNYGFNVEWNGSKRTLSVYRALGKMVTGGKYTTDDAWIKVGTPVMPVLYTDIKTYLDGKLVTSYNVGGKTIIYVDDLNNSFGK